MKRYRLTPRAEKDLDEISDYIAADDPVAASRFIDKIEAKCQALAQSPGIGRTRAELGPNLRSSHVGKYVIFYRADDRGIEVIRVIHGQRDIPSQFGG
jgi:toxin ParE1/3/4